MPDLTCPDPSRGGDRIRALENDRAWHEAASRTDSFRGLRELDRALATNRLTGYSAKKMWRDPLARLFVIVGALVICVGWAYLALQ